MMKLNTYFLATLILIFAASTATAIPTQIMVRIKSKDAKFVGRSMGGMLVTIRDVDSGEMLAKGIATGSTGNTGLDKASFK